MANQKKPHKNRDSNGEEKGWKSPHRKGCLGRTVQFVLWTVVVLALLAAVLPFTPYMGKVKRGLVLLRDKLLPEKVIYRDREVPVEVQVPGETPEPREVIREVVRTVPAPPPPLPSAFVPRKEVEIANLFNGITIESKLDAQQGNYASLERGDKDAYKVEFKVNIRVPKPSNSLAELTRVNAHLPKMLPGLGAMMETSKVSGFYHKLYENKTARIQRDLTRLNRALDRHNFFDTETILELTHPNTQRRILLIQSEMDVVADGSDGDRMPVMNADIYESAYYQPSTSYEWAKKGTTQNPLLPKWQVRLDAAKKEYAQRGLSRARNAELQSQIQNAEAIIRSLKTRSSLIAEKDPFIVLSLLFRGYPASHPHAPGMGDYAAVIHGDKIYPAICGDYGPSFKMGEASLMMAKEINEKATPYIRPESDLVVTYVIFPGTAERPFGPPNLEHWQEKVSAYLAESGGLGQGYVLHTWENPFPPAVAPATTPTPAEGTTTIPPASPAPGATTAPAETVAPAVPTTPAGSGNSGQ